MGYKYNCKMCDYHTNLKSDLTKHKNTKKHINSDKILKNTEQRVPCQYCKKTYSDRQSLSRHKNVCSELKIFEKDQEIEKLKNALKNVLTDDQKAKLLC